jgi:hypothetical protein
VIGVHTPRADYEKDVAKLREAIKGMASNTLSSSITKRESGTTIAAICGRRSLWSIVRASFD